MGTAYVCSLVTTVQISHVASRASAHSTMAARVSSHDGYREIAFDHAYHGVRRSWSAGNVTVALLTCRPGWGRATARCERRSIPDPASAPRRAPHAPHQGAWRVARP